MRVALLDRAGAAPTPAPAAAPGRRTPRASAGRIRVASGACGGAPPRRPPPPDARPSASSAPNRRVHVEQPLHAAQRPTIASAASCSRPLRGQRVAAIGPRARRPRSVNRPPASSTITCGAARSHSETCGSQHDLGGALGDEHVGPEVAEPARAPAACARAASSASSRAEPSQSSSPEMHSWASPSVAHAGHAQRSRASAESRRRRTRRRPRTAHQRRRERRRRDDPEDELAVLLERDQRRPHGDPAHVVLGAVDRVDDPPPRAARALSSRRTPRRAPSRRAAAAASRSRSARSTSRSASVTGVRSGLVST